MNIPHVLKNMFTIENRRTINLQMSGSGWTFYKYVAIALNASTDSINNTGLADNLVGDKGHDGDEREAKPESAIFVLSEEIASDDDNAAMDEEEEETEADRNFIDDTEQIDEEDRSMYWRDMASVRALLLQKEVVATAAVSSSGDGGENLDGYLPDNEEAAYAISSDECAAGEWEDDED